MSKTQGHKAMGFDFSNGQRQLIEVPVCPVLGTEDL